MIEVQGLTKRYGAQRAVDGVSFRCAPGTVTGFLGPNGAGKSTTMRMICGLTRPTAGSATVLGAPYAALANPGREIGVLLDASAQHAGRTGREALALSASVLGVDRARVVELLDRVGLSRADARKRVGTYSLGMRQRLGIAHALLGDPRVLVLDEPANGLDPEGIRWMRQLLRDFADRAGTVLLSSHLLREVEAVADHLVVIGAGRIVADGPKEGLLAGSGTVVRAPDAGALRAALAAAGLQPAAGPDGGFAIDAEPEAVGRAAAAAGVALAELRKTVDTRAGRWLLAIVALLIAATVVISVLVGEADLHRLDGMFEFALAPIGILLPVLGILSVTSEWTQRTTLLTFALVPRRERVTVAKALAACALGALGLVACLVAAAVGNVVDGSWAFGRSRLGNSLLLALISMLSGVAFGLVFLSSAPAIVVYFVLPTIWSILGETIPALERVAPWLDTSPSTTRLAEDTMGSGGDWARLGTSLLLWLALPLVVGVWRVRRSEVK